MNKYGLKSSYIIVATIFALLIVAVIVTLGRISAHPQQNVNTPLVSSPTTLVPVTSAVTTIPPEKLVISKGNPDAPVTIIEFADFLCPNCQQFALNVEKELDAKYIDTGEVYLIYKFTRGWGAESKLANEAAACAAEQGQFWPYYFLLMEQHASQGKNDLPTEKLQLLAQQIGLNMDQFNSSLLSGKYQTKITGDDAESQAMGVISTPTFFINDIKKEGAKTLVDLQIIIDAVLTGSGK